MLFRVYNLILVSDFSLITQVQKLTFLKSFTNVDKNEPKEVTSLVLVCVSLRHK